MQPDPLKATDAERRERPLVLEASELPLDSATGSVEVARAGGLSRDQRVEAVGFDPA
jgi:hypothetical protein